jgi:cytochrome P450
MITGHAEALALLCDPRYDVVPADTHGATAGVGWLRAAVCRFATGAVHARRRALVEQRIAALDVTALRRHARELSTMDADPGSVTVAVLAHALGIPVDVAPLVAAMSPAYFPGTAISREANAAVDALVTVLGGRYDEQTAATIAILVQAHDAMRGLVTRARGAGTSMPVEALLIETLRWDPPVAWLRRVGPDGEQVGIDVRAANQDADFYLTFGAGPRPCPGAEQALAIAAGILESG